MEKMVVDLSKYNGNPDYDGSVQELYHCREYPGYMVCKTTSGGSVFDVGTIFSINGSDTSRTALRHMIYTLLGSPEEWSGIKKDLPVIFGGNEQLMDFLRGGLLDSYASQGADTHHVGMIDRETGEVLEKSFPASPSPYVMVKRYNVIRPRRVKHFMNNLWDYSRYYSADKYVVPLENIVRFGVVPGSSVYRKYISLPEKDRKAYLDELGLNKELVPWSPFDVPTVDFTTKYEPEDRNLSLQEALYVSGCGGDALLDIIRMSILGAALVSRFFQRLGLFLWDLKWEIAKDGDRLVFVDTIDTDSIRVTTAAEYKGKTYYVSINKQSMRDYYKIMHKKWYEAVGEAKKAAAKSGLPFHHHLEAGQKEGRYPGTPVVDGAFISIQEEKFNAMVAYIYGHRSAGDTAGVFREISIKEIQYYEINNSLDEYFKINGAV
ncbi:MAG: phosphoribosylaminoimidazolesuccinocarboxamide synthase [Bacillota bacterium]